MKVNNICIFGAGSAGWLTALILNSYLEDVDVTILCPTKYSNIGVGESTQPNLIDVLRKCKIDLHDFMVKTSATLKHGIHYRGWNEGQKDYWHPFSNMTNDGFFTDAHRYIQNNLKDPEKYPLSDYYKKVHPTYDFCVEQNNKTYTIPFALHVDADKLAEYIRNLLKDKIKIIDIDSFEIFTENNKISKIVCNESITIESDLFVDCSGFSRVLSKQLEGTVYDGYEGNVNAALFARLDYNDVVKPFPYTRAEAFDYGWIWSIPLQTRMGTGCVYNKDFCSEEKAKEYFLDYWKGSSIKKENIKSVSFSSSSMKNPWLSNVVSIGLSSVFIEPLEATGIAAFVFCAEHLCFLLDARYYDEDTIQQYNSMIRMYVEDIQDFVDAHYMLSNRRNNDFWLYQTSRKRSDRLLARLEIYKKYMPNKNTRNMNQPWSFNDISWIDILIGYNFKFDEVNIGE